MKFTICMLLIGAGYLTYFLGGIVLVGLFFYGIYTLFATSVAYGLMMLGATMVGGWMLQLVSGILIGIGNGLAATIGDSNNL